MKRGILIIYLICNFVTLNSMAQISVTASKDSKIKISHSIFADHSTVNMVDKEFNAKIERKLKEIFKKIDAISDLLNQGLLKDTGKINNLQREIESINLLLISRPKNGADFSRFIATENVLSKFRQDNQDFSDLLDKQIVLGDDFATAINNAISYEKANKTFETTFPNFSANVRKIGLFVQQNKENAKGFSNAIKELRAIYESETNLKKFGSIIDQRGIDERFEYTEQQISLIDRKQKAIDAETAILIERFAEIGKSNDTSQFKSAVILFINKQMDMVNLIKEMIEVQNIDLILTEIYKNALAESHM